MAKTQISPHEIFAAVLAEQVSRGKIRFATTRKKMHMAFYQAKQEFPEIMEGYGFLVRTEPYSHTLEEVMWAFRQSGSFGRDPAGDNFYRISNLERFTSLQPAEDAKQAAEYICDRL